MKHRSSLPRRLVVLLLTALLPAMPTAAAPVGAGLRPATVYLQWFRLNPAKPASLYAGGSLRCPESTASWPCPPWIARSDDAGSTWQDLTSGLSGALGPCSYTLSPVLIASDGHHLYTPTSTNCGSPASQSSAVFRSADGGLAWQQSGRAGQYGGGYRDVALSPWSPARLAAYDFGDEGGGLSLIRSDDSGLSWRAFGSGDPFALVPSADRSSTVPNGPAVFDPTHQHTVYVNLATLDNAGRRHPTFVARSIDDGATWTALPEPPVAGAAHGFAVAADPQWPGLLVGQAFAAAVPASRRYLSDNQGQSWQTGSCAGLLAGTCPAWVVQNSLGAGYTFGFYADGPHRFTQGAGGDPHPLAGTTLPLPFTQIVDVAAGDREGDPLYLLGSGANGQVRGRLYRSLDNGHSWRLLPAGLLPNLQPPATSPGALLVPQTHHAVAAAFTALYRSLGLQTVGYPITEAFVDDGIYTQYFQRLRLELRSGKAAVGTLGSAAFTAHLDQGDTALSAYQYGGGAVNPLPNTPSRLYFPATRHTLQGDLLRFWQQHGGLNVLGAPITEVVKGQNGDGTHRLYAMQYFQKARLERHPENKEPRYAIQLGLIGPEALAARGWLTGA